MDTDCPADKFEKAYLDAADLTALGDDKYSAAIPATSAANSATHTHTRILIRLNPCSVHVSYMSCGGGGDGGVGSSIGNGKGSGGDE